MPGVFILFFIAAVTLIIFGAIQAHREQQARQEALTALADSLGWRFDSSYDYDHERRFRQFGIFSSGKSQYAYNTLDGDLSIDGQPWWAKMGDYHYETTSGTGKDRKTTSHYFSYLLVQSPYEGAPSLRIRREMFFDRMASFMGFDDIDFESAEFSDRFHVKSSDKRFAYDVIHPRMMDFLLTGTPPTIHFDEGYCCIFTEGKCWTPEQFASNVSWMQEFFSHWPRHVTSSL